MKFPLPSPLRYPGGKSKFAPYLSELIDRNSLEYSMFVEPYAGGAGAGLYLLGKGIIGQLILVERDPLISSFWKVVMSQPDELIKRIYSLNVSLKTWEAYQKYLKPDAEYKYSTLELAVAGLFFNRANFSGILKGGPIGGMGQASPYKIDCRFNKERICNIIEDISSFSDKIEVYQDDALSYLKTNKKKLEKKKSLVYLDPPYYLQGKSLYRHYYEELEHQKLAEFLLKQNFNWIVSYDNCAPIRKLYKGSSSLKSIYVDYSVNEKKEAKEILISNLVIPPSASVLKITS